MPADPLAVLTLLLVVLLLAPGGATAASALTPLHFAVAFALKSPCVYGWNDTAPVLSSCTIAETPAKYVARASFVLGAGKTQGTFAFARFL